MIQKYIEQITTLSKLSKQEAIWLLEYICQESYSSLLYKKLTPEQEKLLATQLDQIIHENKPLSYIIGLVPFLDLKIKVTPPILIPRPETEEWVHQVIEKLNSNKNQVKKILDIGTGSGAIALSLAKNFPDTEVWAIDINQTALRLAQENAELNAIKNVKFLESDLFEKLQDQKFDLIVSNPPYIPEKMKDTLSATVTQWEDPKALFSGPAGLNLIELILKESQKHLNYNPHLPFQLVIEIDTTQYESIQNLSNQHSWVCSITKDLFGNWRTAWCTKITIKRLIKA
jgi:release factor glutamine methyltransferase